MAGRARVCMGAVDEAIAGKEWLCGAFTAAEVMMAYTLFIYRRILPDDAFPANAAAYWERLEGRPAYAATREADRSAKL